MSDNLSYLSTPMAGNYLYEALPDRLRHLAEEDGDREAFVYYDIDWKREAITRQELLDRTMALARVLVKDGLRHGASVGFCMSNSITMVIANFAVSVAGGIPFFMGTNLKDGSDLIETLKNMNCELFLIDTDGNDDNWNILDILWPISESTSSVTTLKKIICHGNMPTNIQNRISLHDLMNRKEPEVILPEVQPEDILSYFCTSGSTGKPKEVAYTHYGMFEWVKQSNGLINVDGKTRLFFDRTFSWVGGYPKMYLTDGPTRIFVDPRLTLFGLNVEKLADMIFKEDCDIAVMPAYIAVDFLNNPHLASKFQKVKGMILTGERMAIEHVKLRGTFCKDLYCFYGTTESGGCLIYKGDSNEEYEDGIVGTPIPSFEIKIIDDDGKVVPRGAQGELCTRGTSGFLCYRNDEALTRKSVDSADWFHTGDIAHIRDDGNVVVDGRRVEMISMQTNIYFPWSVEKELAKMEGANRAFAVGVPDKRLNQVFCACVLPNDDVDMTSEDIKKYCDGIFLEESTAFGISTKPTYHLVLDTVPLLATGKTDRRAIAAIARYLLGL